MKWTAWGLQTDGEGGKEGHLLVSAEADPDAPRSPVVVNLLLDRSGSMKGAPMAAAVEAAQQLVDQAGPEDFLGLLVFDAVPEQRVALMAMNERGKKQLLSALSDISTGRGTALHQAVDLGAKALSRLLVPGRRSKLLLLTDGEPSVGPEGEGSFMELGQRVAQSGVGVHALGLGRHYLPEILAALTLPSENGYEHVDGPDGLPVAMGAVCALLFGEAAQNVSLQVRPDGFMALACRHGFPTKLEQDSMVVTLGALARALPRRVLLTGALSKDAFNAEIVGSCTERGDSRRQTVTWTPVSAGSSEGRLVRAVGLELDLVAGESMAWLSLAQKDPERAGAVLLTAEQTLRELGGLNCPEIAVDRHRERVTDLRAAVERGEGDIPMMVRRAKAAKVGTHVSQVIHLAPHLAKKH